MTKAAVRTVLVVMLDIGPQDADKLPAADDQQLVQAFSPDRADPPFGDRVGVGCLLRVCGSSRPPSSHRCPRARRYIGEAVEDRAERVRDLVR
jgi:hypothetical protein